MNRFGLLLIASVFVSFTACMDLPVEPLIHDYTLTFKAVYDGQPLEKYKYYPYSDYQIRFSRFQTYVSDIILLKGTEEVPLSEIQFVEFTPDAATTNLAVDVPFTFQVPEGEYTGMKLGIGVKPELNAKTPADFPAGHPLTLETEYWVPWHSFIFTKVEGQGDGDNNGQDEIYMLYHCGSSAVYRTVTFDHPITVREGAGNTIYMDLKKLFTMNGQPYDLKDPAKQFTSNNPNNIVVATELMNNIVNAVSIQ